MKYKGCLGFCKWHDRSQGDGLSSVLPPFLRVDAPPPYPEPVMPRTTPTATPGRLTVIVLTAIALLLTDCSPAAAAP